MALKTAPSMPKTKEESINGKRPEAPQTTESLVKQVTVDNPEMNAASLLSNRGSSKKLDKKQVKTKKSVEKSPEEKTQKARKREIKAKGKEDGKAE